MLGILTTGPWEPPHYDPKRSNLHMKWTYIHMQSPQLHLGMKDKGVTDRRPHLQSGCRGLLQQQSG